MNVSHNAKQGEQKMNEFAKTARRGCATLFAVSCAAAMMPMAAYTTSLPDGYIRLNYIESTTKQAIRTGYTPAYGDRIECVVKVPASAKQQTSWPTLFGTRTSNETQRYYIRYNPSDNSFRFGHNSQEAETATGSAFDTGGYEGGHAMRIVCQTNVLSWTRRDGSYAGQIVATAGSFTPPGQLAIFSCQHGDNNWTSGAANMRLYSFTISNAAGEIQCNFVPCRRKSDGLVGLYDTVRETFCSNNTTSTSVNFTAGPVPGDLPYGYTRLEYIESTYKQCIFTGFAPAYGDRIECNVKLSSSHTGSYIGIFGKRDAQNSNNYYFQASTDGSNMLGYNNTDYWGDSTYFSSGEGTRFRTACNFLAGYDGGYIVHVAMQTNVVEWARLDGSNYGYVAAPAGASQPTMNREFYIFGLNHGGNKWVSNPVNMRLYSYTVTSPDGTLRSNFVPCRNPSGLVGLYDTVRDCFKANESTNSEGPFTAGGDYDALPEGYTKAKWIQSTTVHQYIDTGYYHGTNDLVVMDYYALKSWQDQGYCYLWGSRMPSSGNHTHANNWSFYIGGKNQNRVNYNHHGSKGNDNPSASVYNYADNPIHLECQASTARWTCGDATNSFTTTSTFSDWADGKWPLWIFTGDCGGVVAENYTTVMRLYYFKIYREIDGQMVLVRDFVPCLNESGAAGLFDKVERRFHGNARSGVAGFRAYTYQGMVLTFR